MVRKYFGTDGVRGRANATITPELALKVGQAAGLLFLRGEHRHRVVIGKDTRLSGYMIETAMIAGFTSVGMDVLQLGPMPTPAVAMLARSMRAQLGRAKRIDGVHDRYIEAAKRTLPRNLDIGGLRVVVDCANGATYRVAPAALWELGAEVIAIGVEPDGFNINKECGSVAPEALCQKVREVRADIGIALDGDGDRVIIADEKGHLIDGDQLMAVVAESWLRDGRLSKPGIVSTVMANLGLERHLAGLGLALARTPVGDRYVLEYMREHGFNVGGEPSGHVILSDYTTTGDGLVTALQVLAVVKNQSRPVSQVCHRFEPLPQVMKNVRYKAGKPLEHAHVRSAIAAAERRLDGQGRLVVRPSGTEPVIRVMGEGDDRVLIEEIVDGIVEALAHAAA